MSRDIDLAGFMYTHREWEALDAATRALLQQAARMPIRRPLADAPRRRSLVNR